MENRESIEQVFDNMDNSVVYKSKPSAILSFILILLGVFLIAINGKIVDSPNSIISPLFIVAGVVLLAWGIVSLFFRKTKYKSAENKQNISFSEIFYDIKERDRLVRIINEGDVQELSKLKKSANDAIKLRIAATADGNIFYTQVVTYVPFEFVNATDAKRHNPDEAKIIMEAIKTQ